MATNDTAPAQKQCFQCHRPAEPDDGRCRFCNLEVEASEAFWAVIVQHFPEARFGDLSPWRTICQRMANVDAIEEWISNNVESENGDHESASLPASSQSKSATSGTTGDGRCKAAAADNRTVPWYIGVSECQGVYGGQEHWAVLANNQGGVIADIEGGLAPEPKARAEFIVRACNAHDELLAALEDANESIGWFYEADRLAAGEHFGAALKQRMEIAIAKAKRQ